MPRKKTTAEEAPEAMEPLEEEQAELALPPEETEASENPEDGESTPPTDRTGESTPEETVEESAEEIPAEDSPVFMEADLEHPNGEEDEPNAPDIPYGEDAPAEDVSALPETPVEREGPRTAANPQTDERRAFYGLDFNDLDRGLTPEQRQEWNSIYASFRGRSVMTGAIAGVDRLRMRVRDRSTGEMKWQRMFCAIVIPFRVRILIPETELWMPGEERPNYVLRNIPSAVIDFVITSVDREGGYAIASRKQALPSRRYYFATQPSMNRPGSRISCNVLVVGPRRCLVSCGGYDLDLTQRDLSWTAVPDLRDKYHAGDTLGCLVKSFDRQAGKLSVSVKEMLPNPYDGAAFRHPEQSHRQAVISGKYGGGIFCNLPDGVTVMCNYSFHYDDSAFRIGDRVILIIQRYDDAKKQIYGKIVAKV